MSALARLSSRALAARVAWALAALAACDRRAADPPPPEHAEPDTDVGLASILAVTLPFECVPSRSIWNELVTPAWRDRSADPLGLEAFRRLRLDGKRRGITARPLYADDLTVPASLRRVRPAVPVGARPMVAFVGDTALPAIFIYHRPRWRCLVDLDGLVIGSLEDDACRAAYIASSSGRCLDLSAPVASAAIRTDTDGEARACARLVAQGCGSVPAPP